MKYRLFSLPRVTILCLALLALLCGLASAAETDRQTLELKLGGSELIKTPEPFRRVSIADPTIADVVVLSPREIYVFGKKVGYTSMILWDEEKGKTLLDVVVSLDLTALKHKLNQFYPDQKIEVYASETGVVLSGTVTGPEVVEQVIRLTQTFLPKTAEGSSGQQGTGKSGTGITNLLKVGGIQQVMLEVKFAEVTRDSSKNWQAALGLSGLGNDLTGGAGVGTVTQPIQSNANAPFPAVLPGGVKGFVEDAVIDGLIQGQGSLLLNFADLAANVFVNIDNLTVALQFLEQEGLARTLAEPRLVTQSGQEASFLAGGEFPIPVVQGGGTGLNNSITIEYKEFGVGLRFTPVVLSDGKISLKVAPSVSNIVSTSTIPSGIIGANFVVPSLTTRKLDTTVQLYDGQTLALAGLLQDDLRESVRKVPGLGDLPIIGSLFRSTSFLQDKTDLLISVTPHIVKPEKEGTLNYPGEFMKTPNSFEFYLEGRLEGRRSPGDVSSLSKHSFALPAVPMESQGGLEGQFGQEPVSPAQQ
jgi:pilus assembly protein CpaC